MPSIEAEQIITQEPTQPTEKKGLLRSLRRAFFPVGLAVALGLGTAGASAPQSRAGGFESGGKNTPTDIVPPAEVELIPLAKPTNIDSHQ